MLALIQFDEMQFAAIVNTLAGVTLFLTFNG